MQTYIYMNNYRGFTHALIPLRQVNFLVGENSTGKSSFLELLEVFNQFAFWIIQPNFGITGQEEEHFLDLVSASSENKDSFSIGAIEVSDDPTSPAKGMVITYVNSEWRAVPKRVSLVNGLTIRTVDAKTWVNEEKEYFSRNHTIDSAQASTDIEFLEEILSTHDSDTSLEKRELTEKNVDLPFFMRFNDFYFDGKGMRESAGLMRPEPFYRTFYELAPIRTAPRRTYDAPQTRISPTGEHIPYLVKKALNKAPTAEDFKKFLTDVGASSGLFSSLNINEFGSDPLAPFEMKIKLGNAMLGLQNVGYGVSQSLPVIVEAFVRPVGTAFNIQQPEVHLHPRAQAAIGDVIADLSRTENKVFFVETHSDFTIDRFRLNVRRNHEARLETEESNDVEGIGQEDKLEAINEDFSQILYFERDDAGNRATSIAILGNGDLSEDQPSSYREFFLNESLALL